MNGKKTHACITELKKRQIECLFIGKVATFTRERPRRIAIVLILEAPLRLDVF